MTGLGFRAIGFRLGLGCCAIKAWCTFTGPRGESCDMVVDGLGFGVWKLGFRVWGFGFRSRPGAL